MGLETRTLRPVSLRCTWSASPNAGRKVAATGNVQNREATVSWGAHIKESGSNQDDLQCLWKMISVGLREGRNAPSLFLPGCKEIRAPLEVLNPKTGLDNSRPK